MQREKINILINALERDSLENGEAAQLGCRLFRHQIAGASSLLVVIISLIGNPGYGDDLFSISGVEYLDAARGSGPE